MISAFPHLRDRAGGPLGRLLVALAVLFLAASLAAASFPAFGSFSDDAEARQVLTAPSGDLETTPTDAPLDDASDRDSLPGPGTSTHNATLETADDSKAPTFAALIGGFGLLVGLLVYGTRNVSSPTVRRAVNRIYRDVLSRPPPAR